MTLTPAQSSWHCCLWVEWTFQQSTMCCTTLLHIPPPSPACANWPFAFDNDGDGGGDDALSTSLSIFLNMLPVCIQSLFTSTTCNLHLHSAHCRPHSVAVPHTPLPGHLAH